MRSGHIVIVGSSGHSASVAEAASSAGFVVGAAIDISSHDGGFDLLLESLRGVDLDSEFLALGLGANHLRNRVHAEISRTFPNAVFPPVIHRSAWVSPTARIADGAVLLAQSNAGAGTYVGIGGLLNVGSSLDHDNTFGDFASLGPGARTGGNVTIGARTMVGLQAGILQGRTVGEDSVVGAQSLVLEDIPPLSVSLGSPCKVVRSRNRDDPYY